jgi:hypothetical protein
MQGVPPRRRCRSVFASESPSATKDRKAKQYTLGTSGNDRQDDDHAPGMLLEGRTKLERHCRLAKNNNGAGYWTGLSRAVEAPPNSNQSAHGHSVIRQPSMAVCEPESHSEPSGQIMVQAAVRATPPSREGSSLVS